MTDTFDKIKGTIVYCQIDKPTKGFKDPVSGAQSEDEWKVGVIMTDEVFVDKLKKHATKNKWKMSAIKDIHISDDDEKEEFAAKYHCEIPELAVPNQRKVWLLTLRKSTKLGKTGNDVPEIYRPKVYQKVGNTLLDITHDADKIPGNGSEGFVSLSFFERNTGVVQVNLKNVLITKLVPYARASGEAYSPGAEFDDADIPASAFKDAAPAKAAKTAKVAKAETSDIDSDLPF